MRKLAKTRRLERAALLALIVACIAQSVALAVKEAQINRLFQLVEGWKDLYYRQKAKVRQ